MKKLILIFTIFLTVNLTFAQVENYNDYDSLEIEFNLDSDVSLSGTGILKKLTASVFLFPKDDTMQNVVSFNEFSNPAASTAINNDIIFEWTEKNSNYNFGYDAVIKTNNKIFPVPEIKFPYSDLPNEYQKYLNPGEIIDLNSDIVSTTSQIIGNEDNAYLAVHKIALWTHDNIEYSLNTLTAKAAKQSSWVLANRQGVCDELTSLFISMVRSIGIPARFVAGMAYTNAGYYFGNHGWAEVYYPGYGWVPYDVTYGQLGWIDPSHVSLQKSVDVESSIIYQWQSTGDLQLDSSREIDTKSNILNLGDKRDKVFDVSIKALKNNVKAGSYVPIRVKIKNPYNGYLTNQIFITKAPSSLEKNEKIVALKPLEEKEVYYIVKPPTNINKNLVYTALVESKDMFGVKDSALITFGDSDEFEEVTLKEAEDIVSALSYDEESPYSNQIVLNCNPTKSYYYSFETPEVNCLIRTFNSDIQDLSLCLEGNCKEFGMLKNQEKEFLFTLENDKDLVLAILQNNEIKINRNVLLFILEKPTIKISGINISKVNYNEEIEFPIIFHSDTPIENLKININNLQPIYFNNLEGTRESTIGFNTRALNSEKVKIKLEFEDEYGNKYNQEYSQNIRVNGLPWYWRIINLFRR